MRRVNRPGSLPPGSVPISNLGPSPPPGLPNPHLPITAEQQQAAIVAHRRRNSTVAYDALIAGNPHPEAATIPRPPSVPPTELPVRAAATARPALDGLLHPPTRTNGVTSRGKPVRFLKKNFKAITISYTSSFPGPLKLHSLTCFLYPVNSPTSPAPYVGPNHSLRPHTSEDLPSGSSTATGSPAFHPTSAPIGISSTVPQTSTALPSIPQADGAHPESPLEIAVGPRRAVRDYSNTNQATAPAPVQASDSLTQAVAAPDPTGISNLTISDTASAPPKSGSSNTSQ
ncbi:hypothetical protein BKA65DRAFT_573425 [Rhexocercosporidium sp. MPI-PUGE-AT-0058]|nr:hypothetical protein BKA65DRAFT_573425 [Rhexocercosporidium sp. MPI-PUGE-AT-0058]